MLLEALISELPPGPTRARALKELALARTDDAEIAQSPLQQALAEAEDDDHLRARIEPELAVVLRGGCKFSLAAAHARLGLESAHRARDPGLLARALAADAMNAFFAEGGIKFEQLARGITLEDESDAITYKLPTTVNGNVLWWSDDLDGARQALGRAMQRAVEHGEDSDVALFWFHLAVLEWKAGDHQTAERCQSRIRSPVTHATRHSDVSRTERSDSELRSQPAGTRDEIRSWTKPSSTRCSLSRPFPDVHPVHDPAGQTCGFPDLRPDRSNLP